MLIAFLAPRVQLAKLCESGLAQQFAASPALLLCDIRPCCAHSASEASKVAAQILLAYVEALGRQAGCDGGC